MFGFLAHKKLFSCLLDLGVYDELFSSMEKYIAGDKEGKEYIQRCSKDYSISISINFPRNDKFTKDLNYSLFFDGIKDYLTCHSTLVLYTLLKEAGHTDVKEYDLDFCEKFLEGISEGQIKQALENLDFEDLDSYEFDFLLTRIKETALDLYIDTLPTADDRCEENYGSEYPFSYLESFRHFELSDEVLKTKFGYLNVTASDILQQKTKSNANSAASAHKKRVKKHVANNKQASNKPPVLSLGYRLSDDLPLSYFQPSKRSDAGFNIVKNIDLFGLHLILVAYRRKYYLEVTLSDEFRGNYDVLERLDLDELVSLHDKAVKACQDFKATCTSALTSSQIKAQCLSAYIKRNNALFEYAKFYNELFDSLNVFDGQINSDDQLWLITKNFFNHNLAYVPLIKYLKDCVNSTVLFLFSNNPNKAVDFMRNCDNKLIEKFNSCAPMTIYQACSKFASTFDSIESTHPLVADFKDIAQKVITYGQELKPVCPHFPFPVKLDNYFYQPLTYQLSSDQSSLVLRDTNVNNDPDKFNICSQELELSRNTNDFVFIFSCLSVVLDAINDLHIQLFSFNTQTQGMPALFNWYGDNSKEVETIFPIYKQWCDQPSVVKLADAHKRCFELLVLILDLRGNLGELYDNTYFVELLKKTDSYDEGWKASPEPTLKLSSREKVLLDKAIINFVKVVNEFTQTFYELSSNSDLSVNEILVQLPKQNQIDYNGILSHLKFMLHMAYYFSNSLIISLDEASEDIKPNCAGHEQDYEHSKTNVLFYKNIKEVVYILFGKNFDNFALPLISYWNYQDLDSFKKYYSLACPGSRFYSTIDSTLVPLAAIERMLALNPRLDNNNKDIIKLKQSMLCEHSFAQLLIIYLDKLSYLMLCGLGCCLVQFIAKLTTKRAVVAHLEDINILVSLTKRLNTISSLTAHANSIIAQALTNHFFLTENEEFKDVIRQFLKPLKLLAQAVCHPDYADFPISQLNDNNYLTRVVFFLEQLLTEPAKVLAYLNPEAIRQILCESEEQAYASSAPFYGPVVFNLPFHCLQILKESSMDKNTVAVFLTLFGKEFTQKYHPLVYTQIVEPGTDCTKFFSARKKQVKCKPIVEKALSELLKELNYDAMSSVLGAVDIYQGIDTSVDNWDAQRYADQRLIELPDSDDFGYDENDESEFMAKASNPLKRKQKDDPLTMMASLLRGHKDAAALLSNQADRARISRRLNMIHELLQELFSVTYQAHLANRDFEELVDQATDVYFGILSPGMHRDDVHVLANAVNIFLDYVENIYGKRSFLRDLYCLSMVVDSYKE